MAKNSSSESCAYRSALVMVMVMVAVAVSGEEEEEEEEEEDDDDDDEGSSAAAPGARSGDVGSAFGKSDKSMEISRTQPSRWFSTALFAMLARPFAMAPACSPVDMK